MSIRGNNRNGNTWFIVLATASALCCSVAVKDVVDSVEDFGLAQRIARLSPLGVVVERD